MSDSPTYEVPIAGETDGSGDRIPDLSPREALERWLSSIRVSKAESTVSAYWYQLKHFAEFCEEEEIVSISDVSGWDLEEYKNYRLSTGMKAATLNKEFLTLRSFLQYCARVELVDDSLPEKVDPPDVSRDEFVDDTRLHSDNAKSLLDYYEANEYGSRAHVLLALEWYTGARLGAIRGLDIDDYDSEREYLQFFHRPADDTPLKNGKDGERAVGLPTDICEIIDTYLAENRHAVHDDNGRRPLVTSEVGRPSRNAVRAWTYIATVPCIYGACPHGNNPETCDYLSYSTASQCPSSRSPHQVRTGSITWQLNRGVPIEKVAKRVNTSVRVLKKHYDKPTELEDLEERRREYVDRLSFGDSEGGGA
ncbi:tyrosine-type recombinase/integrase [Halopelagius longus]|uniref:tyrosine-type recombinase/integrase n=1 Tax=Halopelagius longus TaxID=1236180 RepID=UPI001587AD80|nr:site-specific integrase [Halopelagius longus]